MLMHHRGVAVTGAVHSAIADVMDCRKLPDLAVKWRETPVEQWEVAGLL